MPGRLLVISPLHNEAAHIPTLVACVASQTRPPDLWVLVDDGSTDETRKLVQEACAQLPYARALSVPQDAGGRAEDGLSAGLEARAFNRALRQVGPERFEYIGKLDGDIELVPGHYERLLSEFELDGRLGIVGSAIAERRAGQWCVSVTPPYFVHGAVKLYSRECLAAIGGIEERLGWDIVDEARARLRGYGTRSLPDLVSRHRRQSGSAQGRLRGHARAGESAWIAHYPAVWILLRSFKEAAKRPRVLSGAAFAFGFARAAARRVGRVDDPVLREFVRAELNARLRSGVRNALRSPRWPRTRSSARAEAFSRVHVNRS